jgi:negative regulator of sigma E activity
MTQEISSLMDGELESHEAERAIRGCCADSEAARKWQEYHLISDVLRGGRPHPSGTAERVRKLLESEPAIVARPRRVLDTTFGRLALAAAASVATIGVVGWIGSQGGQPVPGAVIAKNPAAAPAVQPVVNRIEPAPDVQE